MKRFSVFFTFMFFLLVFAGLLLGCSRTVADFVYIIDADEDRVCFDVDYTTAGGRNNIVPRACTSDWSVGEIPIIIEEGEKDPEVESFSITASFGTKGFEVTCDLDENGEAAAIFDGRVPSLGCSDPAATRGIVDDGEEVFEALTDEELGYGDVDYGDYGGIE